MKLKYSGTDISVTDDNRKEIAELIYNANRLCGSYFNKSACKKLNVGRNGNIIIVPGLSSYDALQFRSKKLAQILLSQYDGKGKMHK